MATTSNNKIFIQDGDTVIELIGTDKEAFLEQRVKDQAEFAARQVEQESKAAQKTTILERIGLTKEELQIVLNN
jgi:hypothetical protein